MLLRGRHGMRETQVDLPMEGKCEATWQCKSEVKRLKTM